MKFTSDFFTSFNRNSYQSRLRNSTGILLKKKRIVKNISKKQVISSDIIVCPKGTKLVQDVDAEYVDEARLIPNVIYQTSKSRCLDQSLYDVANQWYSLPNMSVRFFDDEAMDAFLYDEDRWADTFPLLKYALKCIEDVKVPVMKADIWRLLVLWEYGGIYADLDTAPDKGFETRMSPEDDAFFSIEGLGVLTQYFMASSRRHPLIYYAVHSAIQRTLHASRPHPAVQTGPKAVSVGHLWFLNSTNVGDVYNLEPHTERTGENGRRIRLEGHEISQTDKLIIRTASGINKQSSYKNMNMTYYWDAKAGKKFNGGYCYNHAGLDKEEVPGMDDKPEPYRHYDD